MISVAAGFLAGFYKKLDSYIESSFSDRVGLWRVLCAGQGFAGGVGGIGGGEFLFLNSSNKTQGNAITPQNMPIITKYSFKIPL